MAEQRNLPTVVLGGGLAGISAAMHLKRPYLLLEREERLGGLARTTERDGYRFDHTGHWLHLRHDYMKQLVKRLLGDSMVEVTRRARIFSNGALTLYPYQANLKGLPPEVVYECLLGLVNARLNQSGQAAPRNFEEYVLHHFGEGISKHFMIPYNHKLWGVHPSEITSAWCGRYVPIPTIEQVLAGAVGVGPANMGYNVKFLYPREGGIETFTRALVTQLDSERVRLRTAPNAIDIEKRQLQIGQERVGYHALIASIPLPNMVALCSKGGTAMPAEVSAAAKRLRATKVRYLNVATRKPCRADYHWVYVPEERFPFYRVGVFSNAMPTMAPENGSSLYVELASRDHDSSVVDQALRGLVEIGAVEHVDDVLFADLHEIDPAYVIFDEHYESSVKTIQHFLESRRIYCRGRYGSWIYNAMEDSLMSGKEAAELTDGLPA